MFYLIGDYFCFVSLLRFFFSFTFKTISFTASLIFDRVSFAFSFDLARIFVSSAQATTWNHLHSTTPFRSIGIFRFIYILSYKVMLANVGTSCFAPIRSLWRNILLKSVRSLLERQTSSLSRTFQIRAILYYKKWKLFLYISVWYR